MGCTHCGRLVVTVFGLVVAVALPWAGGCSGSKSVGGAAVPVSAATPIKQATVTDSTLKQSGFLKDYSRLGPSPSHPDAVFWQSAKLAAYKNFLIDDIVVLPTVTLRGVPITPATAGALGAALKTEVAESLEAAGYTVVSEPGEGVARIRGAITALSRSRRDADEPVAVAIGGASMEMEILDSLSGAQMGAAIESDTVASDEDVQPSTDPYQDSRLVFRHWASRLVLWLDRAKRGE